MRRLLCILLPLIALGAAAPDDERIFMVTSFERLRVDGPFEVRVIDRPSPKAVASGDRRALQQVEIRLDGGMLVVSAGANGWTARPGEALALPRVMISGSGLRSIHVNGGGRVTADRASGSRVELGVNGAGSLAVAEVDADDLNVVLSGTGLMTLGGTAERARLLSYGAGSIDAVALSVGDATVRAETSGDTRLTARYTAKVSALGLGQVAVAGKANCTISGPGPVTCGGAPTRRR